MYLARVKNHGITHYAIRQSYEDGGYMRSRDLVTLGPDPTRYITYVGGSGYYYDEALMEALADAGAEADQNDLDRTLFDFLEPRIQRVINGFDRGLRQSIPKALTKMNSSLPPPHPFDKRRYHYLRFGPGSQRHLESMPEKFFGPLFAKSRDELEQYFLHEELTLKPHEKPVYVAAIFELKRFTPVKDGQVPLIDQLDNYFVSQLCGLNGNNTFWAGMHIDSRLNDYLTKYAMMYFDFEVPRRPQWQAEVEDFINRHRVYHPPPKVKVKLEEAARLFGLSWKELKKLDKKSLSCLYRRLALKYHPDQGGDPAEFRRLTQYYKIIMQKK
ncbi:MAG: hypothetical protein M0036_21925 [Desulfobacteraceae bacterium]|nr:hypothetical protein [Desulfobacteraceae bacterium]